MLKPELIHIILVFDTFPLSDIKQRIKIYENGF